MSEAEGIGRNHALLQLSSEVLLCRTWDDLLTVVNERVKALLPCERVSLSVYERETDAIGLQAALGETSSASGRVGQRFNVSAHSPPIGAEFCQPIVRGDLSAIPRTEVEEKIFAEGMHSYCLAPLLARGATIGTLQVVSRNKHQYSEPDVALVQDIANHIAPAAWTLHTFEKLKVEIAQRQQVEAVLRESEEFNTRLIEGSQDCIKVLDLDGRLLAMNTGGMRVLEICDFAPLCHSFWIEFWQGEFRSAAERAVEIARNGGSSKFVGYCPTMGGKPMWWDVVVSPILDAQGKPEKLLAVSRDITERKQSENMLRAIVEGTAAVTGKDFFREMVHHLSAAIPVRYAFVTECANPEKTKARILAFWDGKDFAEEFEYDVAKTTCEEVYKGETCFYAREIQKLFPAETALVDLGGESYIGIPLLSTNGEFIGHLAVLDTAPMASPRGLDVLKIFAARAGAELERKKVEDELRAALQEVERLKDQLHAENIYLQEEIQSENNFEEIVGSSPALLNVLQQVERAAPTDATVLILGETGTGKELIARALHSRSARSTRPLVKVNCGSISAGLVESELFGHVKGAFTGAIDKRVGRFALADGGTLFLDEVGELSLETQVKLLRVLQEGEFEPVGSSKTIKVDVRIIAATNRHLEAEVAAGKFRADLFYRLNVLPIHNPALRERRTDIAPLAMFFLSRFARKFGRKLAGITQDAMALLENYSWPGNVRELQNIIERGVVLATGNVLTREQIWVPTTVPHPPLPTIPPSIPPPTKPSRASLEDVERQHILEVLAQTNWVIEGERGAAKILNLHPNTLRSRLKKLNIQRPR